MRSIVGYSYFADSMMRRLGKAELWYIGTIRAPGTDGAHRRALRGKGLPHRAAIDSTPR